MATPEEEKHLVTEQQQHSNYEGTNNSTSPKDPEPTCTCNKEPKRYGKACCYQIAVILFVWFCVESVIVVHFGVWITHYANFTERTENASESQKLPHPHYWYVYREPIIKGNYAHIILCFWVACIALFDLLEYTQFAIGQIWIVMKEDERKLGQDRPKIVPKKPDNNNKYNKALGLICIGVALIILFAFGVAKVALAITMEKRSPDVSVYYLAYCGLEAFHIWYDLIFRSFLMVTLLYVWNLWNKSAPNDAISASPDDSAISTSSKSHDEDENKKLKSLNADENKARQLACIDFNKELALYHMRGERVERTLYPFAMWFLTPWVVYLVSTNINPHYFLAPWTDSKSNIDDNARAYHLVNTAMKTYQLLMQYVFALKVNQFHRDYFIAMKRRVIFKDNSSESLAFRNQYRAEASQLMSTIDYHDDFNFYPTFLWINPRISVDGPFYIVFLLFGMFVNASDQLLHTSEIANIDKTCN